MIVILSNSEDATANYFGKVCAEKSSLEEIIRIDSDKFFETQIKFHDGLVSIQHLGRLAKPEDITGVWFRRPKPIYETGKIKSAEDENAWGEHKEAIEGFLAQIEIKKWINHPSANVSASHKIDQLIVSKMVGFKVPKTIVTQSPKDALEFNKKHNCIVKPLCSGYIQRDASSNDTSIFTSRVKIELDPEFNLVSSCPTLFQEEIEKEFDVRVIVVDRNVDAIKIQSKFDHVDVRYGNMNGAAYSSMEIPKDVIESIFSFMDFYKLRFAAIDFAVNVKGEWIFLENNPNGQWAWLDQVGVSNIASHLYFSLIGSVHGTNYKMDSTSAFNTR